MTATPLNIPDEPTRAQPLPSAAAMAQSRDRKAFATALGVLLVLFLLLQNQYWVPGGDSEVYTGAARSLLLGKGYRFNGVPVSIVPPGWSFVLAGAMKISPQFLFLKLVTMSCMLGSLAMMYWICRRFAAPELSALIVVLSGIVSHVYSLTFWLHSDALFCLVSSAALLLAFQINEGRNSVGRMAALVLLCMATVSVRWAGLLSMLLVCATLLHGELIPRINHRWVLTALCAILTLGTFLGIRSAIRVTVEQQKEITEALGPAEGTADAMPQELAATQYQWINPAKGGWGYAARLAGWGNWFSYLLWQPFRMGRFLMLPSLLFGWIVLLPLLLLGMYAIHSRTWIWVGLILYTLGLALNWPHPVARYLVPVTPLILLGVFTGLPLLFARNWLLTAFLVLSMALVIAGNLPGTRLSVILRPVVIVAVLGAAFTLMAFLSKRLSNPSIARISRGMLVAFAGSLFLCNGALWAVDMYVAHSKDFYRNYEAGLNSDLIAACRWLDDPAREDAQIAISRRYVNMGRLKRDSVLGSRVAAMLTGRAVAPVPDQYVRAPGPEFIRDPRKNPNFLAWGRSLNVRYVLYQTEVSPWRVFPFRMGWLQERMTGEPIRDSGAGWRLYEILPEGDEAKRISIPPVQNWPTRVPGL